MENQEIFDYIVLVHSTNQNQLLVLATTRVATPSATSYKMRRGATNYRTRAVCLLLLVVATRVGSSTLPYYYYQLCFLFFKRIYSYLVITTSTLLQQFTLVEIAMHIIFVLARWLSSSFVLFPALVSQQLPVQYVIIHHSSSSSSSSLRFIRLLSVRASSAEEGFIIV